VMFRASYATGFLPPRVQQIVENPSLALPDFIFGLLQLRDPRRGNEIVGSAVDNDVAVRTGGNPDLQAENSDSWSAGVILTPRFVPGLRLSADWTQIKKTDEIGQIATFQQILELESLVPSLAARSTDSATFGTFGVGPIIGIDGRLQNLADRKIDAYDFTARYLRATARFGEFDLSATATRMNTNESRAVATAPVIDNLGTIDGLQWRGNVTLTWSFANWTAAWAARHFQSYRLYSIGQEIAPVLAAQGSAEVPSQTYHDLFVGYRFNASEDSPGIRGWLSNMEVNLNVSNVFNTNPAVDLRNAAPYYSTLADPRLASYSLSLRKAF
ncbi:MAG: TonB-dependent receptor domain-containing protein, partial [Steroidobacteraceae bacterium]